MFTRTLQLIGEDGFRRLQDTRVILFGVGGVGGWCAEALVRTGLGHLTLVDFDKVDTTNRNRQVVATSANIGMPKAEEMRKRLLLINPDADVTALCQRYDTDSASLFDLSSFDYVLDAIDSVACKAELIYQASRSTAVLFSSMGAGRKLDVSQIRTTEFWKVNGCPLARALRHRFKSTGRFPEKKFTCVFSPEISGTAGTLAPIVGTFGFHLAGLVLNDILHKPDTEFS